MALLPSLSLSLCLSVSVLGCSGLQRSRDPSLAWHNKALTASHNGGFMRGRSGIGKTFYSEAGPLCVCLMADEPEYFFLFIFIWTNHVAGGGGSVSV